MSITQAVTNSKGPLSPGSRFKCTLYHKQEVCFKSPLWIPPPPKKKKRKETHFLRVCERMHSVNPVLQTGKNKVKSPNLTDGPAFAVVDLESKMWNIKFSVHWN